MPNLEDYFGVNVHEEFTNYLVSPELQKWLDTNYPGAHPSISFALLNNDFRSEWNWRNPLGNVDHVLIQSVIWGDVSAGLAPDGTMENVDAKLHFVVREGLDSVEAETHLYLVQPGDFPFQGAGTYRGFTGGVSGRTKREDWMIFCHLVDYLIDLLNQVAERANETCAALRNLDGCPKGLKYMDVIALKRDFDYDAKLWEVFADTEEGNRVAGVLSGQLGLETMVQVLFWEYQGNLKVGHIITDADRKVIEEHIEKVKFAFAA